MRIGEPNLPVSKDGDNSLVYRITSHLRSIANQLNNLSEGHITAHTNAYTAAPTTGTWNLGDFIRNSSPSEAGTAGSKYVVFGYVCVTAGTPGTWKEVRTLTGN